jgi:hypothetical protein
MTLTSPSIKSIDHFLSLYSNNNNNKSSRRRRRRRGRTSSSNNKDLCATASGIIMGING